MISFRQFYQLNESYFDAWKLPDGCEDWRIKYKNDAGLMELNPWAVYDLMIKGCKPMASLETKKYGDLIASMQQAGLYTEVNGPLTFIGKDPEWVKKGIQAWKAQDHVEFGKALGFGEHSINIKDDEVASKQRDIVDKRWKEQEEMQRQSIEAQRNFDHSTVPEL